jgi:ABC-2 type transport system permease protein
MTADLTGTAALTRLAFRRDRVMLPVWVYVIIGSTASTAYTLKKLYPQASSRAALAATASSNPALRFLYGRLYGDSIGALTAWRYGVWAALFTVVMTVFLVVRHTRADEESGRLELVGSAAVGRRAPLTAGLLVAVQANVLLTVLLGLVLSLIGLPLTGAAALSLAIGGCGLAFTGISAVAAQLASGARAARGLTLGVLAVAFMFRAVGDTGTISWLSWLSPLGWTELVRPFSGERWWVLALPVAVCVLGTGIAFALAARRDLGAGLLPDRPGPPSASAFLRGPLGLAWRLQRGPLLGWLSGYVVLFAVSGAAAKGIGQLFGTSTALEREFTRVGGQAGITNAYLAALMLLAGLAAAAYATSVVLGLRADETGNLAEPVLATAVGRVRWAMGHIVVAVIGAAVLLAAGGVAAGLGYGLRVGAAGTESVHLLGAGLAQLPAALMLAAIAVLVFGLVPSASVGIAWTVVGVVVVLQLFGQVLQFSHWVMDVSPFTQVPRLPGGTVFVAPLVWLSVAAITCCLAGLYTFRRRDIG